jgi:plastocyanin
MKLATLHLVAFRAGIVKRYTVTIMLTYLKALFAQCSWILAISLIVSGTIHADTGRGATPTSLAPASDVQEKGVTISIKSREFSPNTVSLIMGQKTRLVLKNLDTELHAFLPVGLLTDIHLNLSGNGAPEFSKEGLVRVLLPTSGQTEIVFIPSRSGTFPYFCDLPGHVMRGTIVVHQNEGMIE